MAPPHFAGVYTSTVAAQRSLPLNIAHRAPKPADRAAVDAALARVRRQTVQHTVDLVSGCEVHVNVNELRLGFSNTTRNPEGILSHNNRKG